MLELLAPAGSMEALYAAVQNGANAVYLGSGIFNARQGAKNFTPQMLTEAVKYCHVRGVAVHLTLNTLVSDREMSDVCTLIRSAAVSGVDAFIVQDLAVVQLCRQIAPHLLRRQLLYPAELKAHLERVMGIEPTRPAWKAGILPLNYTRMDGAIRFTSALT